MEKTEKLNFDEFKMKKHSEQLTLADNKDAQRAIVGIVEKIQEFSFKIMNLEARNEIIDSLNRSVQLSH